MGNFTNLQEVDQFLGAPLDKQKRPTMGPPPPPAPKKPLPEFRTVQDLDGFLKTPLQQYDTTPAQKFTQARESRESTAKAEAAAPRPWYADPVLSDKGIGKAIGVASAIDEPIERGIKWWGEKVDRAVDWVADLATKPQQDQRDWLAANGYPTLAKLSAYGESVSLVNWEREATKKIIAPLVSDPKMAPFLLESEGAGALKTVGTTLFTVLQQYGAVQALQNRDWSNAAIQEAFALLGMKDLSAEVKAKVGEAALEKRLDTLAQGKYKKPWNQLTKPEQAGLAYDMANTPVPQVPSEQVADKAAKGAGEPTAFPKAVGLAEEQARGTAAARAAVPPQMMPPPIEPPPALPFEPGEKTEYKPVTGGTELPQYLNPEEREAKGYYTLEEARKRLDQERKIAAEAEESRSRAEGEQRRISREKAEQSEGEAAYRAARAGGLVVKDRRGTAFDEAGAARNRQERERLSQELDRIANENMYYDAQDMFQSLETQKGRGQELEDWHKEALSLQTKLQDLERLSNPEALPPVRTASFEGLAEETKLASREGEMRDVAAKLTEEAKNVVGDVDEFEKLTVEADEAKDRAEKLRTERDEKEAKRAAETSERAEYPLGAPIESTRGTGGAMILPDGRKIPFHYAVVPMEAVVGSHDPFNNFEPNPEAIAVSQGRDYKNNRESQAATIARGKNPEMSLLVNTSPTAETGPPIIRSDGQALGGRNRVNIWKLLYRNGFGEAAYDYMAEHAREFGVTVEQIVNHKDPMVVRVLDDPYTSAESLAQLGRDLDRTQTMGFSDAETAVMAGRSLNPDTLDWISNQLDAMGEDATLRDLMRFRSGEIIDKMLASNMIEPTKRAEFVTSNGEMTERAKDLFESAVLGKVIDDPELLATTPKDVLRKLERSTAALARVKAAGGVWDFTPELKQSLRLWKRVDSIREALNKIGGPEDSLVDRYLHPGEYKMGTELMDFGGETAREQPHPTVEALAKLLEENGKEIKGAVGDYADDAEGKQMTLGAPPSPVESFNTHIGSKVKVDVPEEAWGTLKAPETPKEAAVEAPKEKAPDVPPPLEATPAAKEAIVPPPLQGYATAADLEKMALANPKTAPMAKEIVTVIEKLIKGTQKIGLTEFLAKKKIRLRDEGTPGEGALEQSAADVGAWARRAGRKLTVAPYGEQLGLFGGAEPQFLLRGKGDERLVLKSELLKIRDDVPRLRELVDPQGNLLQAQMFEGEQKDLLFGPGEEEEPGPQGTLFQTDDEKLAALWGKTKSVGQREGDYFTKAKEELFPGKRELTTEEISKVEKRARAQREAGEPLRQVHKGMTEFTDDGEIIITLFKDKADASTFLHEFFHVVRRYLDAKDTAVLEKWLGIKDGIWTRQHEEDFAKAGEYYHRQIETKKLPEDVRMVFKKIQNIMKDIYDTVKDLVKPSKEVAALFDRWYGKEMEAAPAKPEPPPIATPPVAEGMVRLYRGEAVPGSGPGVPDWVKDSDKFKESQGAAGRWFTTDLDDAKHYAEEAGTGRLQYVDVPSEVAEKYRALNDPDALKYSPKARAGEVDEHFLPREVADSATAFQDLDKPKTERIPPAAEMESPPLSAEDRKDMEMKAQGGILPLDTGKVRVKVFPEFQKAIDWAKANQGKIKGLQVFQLKDGRAVADFTAKNEKVLFQSDPDYEKQRLVAHANVKISNLLDRLKHVMPEMERVKVNAEIQALRARRDAVINPPKSMTPPPGEILTLWTPEGERPIERPSGRLPTEKKASDAERSAVDVSHGNRQPGRTREISEPPIPPRLGESEPRAGRGTGPAGRAETKRAATGEPRLALRDVKPLEIAPSRPRGEPAYAAQDWTDRVEKFKLPENAPAPTVKLKPENARMMMPGQTEVVESILSGLQQHDGYILATTTGTGKTYMGSAVLNEMSKPGSRNLILTPSQGLIHGRDGWIRVAGNFGVEVKPLEIGEMPTEPGTYIATWQGGLTREGIDTHPWDLIVMDEVQEARKWWSSKRGDMSKTMGENAKKILYTSATPFHTALEMGHMGKLGLWGREGFAQWAMKNNLGVYFDKDGNLAGGAAPARLEKLRQQLIERGQFINIDRNMDGYSAHFGKVPMDGVTAKGLRDIDKALQLAENYFAASKRKGMIATTKAQRVTLAKRWLEFQRLPQAIELGKKLEKEGWKVIFFSENKKEFNELFDFLQPADAATGGKISATIPKFGSTIDVLREAFGDDVAVFSGKHSAAREAEKDAFNDDDKKHLYATYSAGGVGVSLHDKAGDKPRAVIYLGPPWSGISFDQALGRPWRYGTKSNVRAYFLFSDSQAEMHLVTNKVAPRMESLRAMVSGVDFKDPVVKNLRSVPENQEGALDYDHGNAHNADFDAFTKTSDLSGVSSYSELPIVSAKEAMHKGMKLPGSEGAQDPSVVRLWQDSPDEEVLPADLEAPELTMARQVNVELAERFIDTGAAPGNAAGRALKPQERRMVADAVLARADAAASTDPASATQQVYTEWENAMKQIDGILALANGAGMEPPPEGIPNVSGSGGETPQPWKMSTWDAVNWYMFTNGRDVMRDVTKRAGVPWVGEKLARSVAQYHTEAGNISGPWETKYWDILKDNKITPDEHKVLALTLANREKPAKWIDNELARLRSTAPMNERIEKAVKQTQDLFKEVFSRMQKDNIYLTVHDAATGRPRQIYYNEFANGEGYFPRRYDYAQVHTVVDPKTGIEHKFTLADLTNKEPGESKREGIINGMMQRHGLSRASVEDWLASKKRDVPLVGHIERAREADLPFFRTDPDVVISYLEGAGELLARKKYFEQDGSKVKGLIAQIPAQKAREIVGGIMDSLLQRNPLQDESKAILRWTSNWAVSKMVFSSLKALTHSIHAAPLTNTRAYLKGVFAGLTDLKDVQRMAQLAGSIQEQTKVEMLAEYGVKKSGFGSNFLSKTGWQGIYKWGRVVSDATARIFMTDYALGKLMKNPKDEVVRRQLRNNMQLDDSRIDAAIARRRWTEEDLAWGGKSMADKTMMTFDKTELPPGWRPRSDDPASDFGGTILRAATILKGYQFKAHALMKDAMWDEARKGNFRPLIPFLLLYPVAGQTIWSLTALATGNIKHFKQLMDDKSWTPGRTVWHMIEDVAHIMADSEATAFFDAAAHGQAILAGKIGTEYVMGPLPSDIGKTAMLPVDMAHAKTAKAKAEAVKRYVEEINPAARTLVNAYEMTQPPPGRHEMTTPPVLH